MRVATGLCLVAVLSPSAALAAPDAAADYVNTIRYADLVGRLRSSFDRYDAIVDSFPAYADNIYARGFLYGYQLDIAINQVSIGAAFGPKRLRWYGLLHTTNITFQDEHQYHRAAIGANLNLDYVQIQADVSYGTGGLSYYAKIASAPIKSSLTLALYPFELTNDRIEAFDSFGKALPNVIRAEFYGFPFALLGAEYNILLSYAKPDITLKLSSLFDFEELKTLPYDVELKLTNNMAKITDFSDITAILSLYYVLGTNFGLNKKLQIVNRPALFGSISYRTGDLLGDRLRAEGVAVESQKGVGFEGGLGLRVFGLAEHGFPADDYVKLTGYYNFPEYHDLLPFARWGIRLTINY